MKRTVPAQSRAVKRVRGESYREPVTSPEWWTLGVGRMSDSVRGTGDGRMHRNLIGLPAGIERGRMSAEMPFRDLPKPPPVYLLPESVPEALRLMAVRADLSLEDLAERADISRTSLSSYLAGRSIPSPKLAGLAEVLADALSYDTDLLTAELMKLVRATREVDEFMEHAPEWLPRTVVASVYQLGASVEMGECVHDGLHEDGDLEVKPGPSGLSADALQSLAKLRAAHRLVMDIRPSPDGNRTLRYRISPSVAERRSTDLPHNGL